MNPMPVSKKKKKKIIITTTITIIIVPTQIPNVHKRFYDTILNRLVFESP